MFAVTVNSPEGTEVTLSGARVTRPPPVGTQTPAVVFEGTVTVSAKPCPDLAHELRAMPRGVA